MEQQGPIRLLAVETSSSVAGAAVVVGGKLAAEEYLDHRLTHSEVILPMVDRVLGGACVSTKEITALAVDVGPGSFTGVRIGVCLANGMAAALGVPVVAVDALEAMAWLFPAFSGVVCPLLDARKDQVYAAAFCCKNGEPVELGERFAGSVGEFLPALRACGEELLFVGDGAAAQKELLRAEFPKARFAPCHLDRPRASAVAAAALAKLERGGTVREAMPLYLKKPQAERMKYGD